MIRSITVTFDRPVVPEAGAFALVGRDGAGAGTCVSFSGPVANPVGAAPFWVLTFSGPPAVGGNLADGVYDLTVVGAMIHTATSTGPTMPADVTFEFHRLF